MTEFYKGNRWTLAALAATMMVSGAAFAQQATVADPYQGVSQPPPDGTIVANPDAVPAATPAAKPSPAVALPAPAPAPVYTPAPPAPQRESNPDFDIVSSVPSQGYAPATGEDTTLHSRPNEDEGIVSSVPSGPNDLPEATNIRVRLKDRLSSKETTVGSPFRGEVTTNVFKDGRVIIPAGSELKGRVVGVTQGHHFGMAATLRLRPDLVILPDGTAYHLFAQVAGSGAPGTRTDSEGGIQPKSHLVKNTVEYGVGAGTGALLGAHFGGPPGALVGAIVGTGVISAHLLMQHPDAAVVPVGSIVTFSLTEPMELTPTRN